MNATKVSEADNWEAKCAEDKCRVIESILKESANKQAAIEAHEPPSKCRLALRRMIDERKRARRAGDKATEKSTSKLVQKELKAIGKARRSAKVESVLRDFCDLKRLEKTRTRKVKEMIGSMMSTDGTVKHSRSAIAEVFADVYRSLYVDASRVIPNRTDQNGPNSGRIDDITQEEVKLQIKKMGNDKGADESGVIAETIKLGGPEIAAELASIFDEVLQGTEEVPAYWKSSKIPVLYK